MAVIKVCNLLLLLFTVILAAYLVEVSALLRSGNEPAVPSERRILNSSPSQRQTQNGGEERVNAVERWRRRMIGSTAPICTYNECKGCKYRCRAEQVPVEGNDPINSAYHYRCVCHR